MNIIEESLDEQLEEGIGINLDTIEKEKNIIDKDHRSEQRFKKWTVENFAKKHLSKPFFSFLLYSISGFPIRIVEG